MIFTGYPQKIVTRYADATRFKGNETAPSLMHIQTLTHTHSYSRSGHLHAADVSQKRDTQSVDKAFC